MTFGQTSTLQRRFSQQGRLKSSDTPWTQSRPETSMDRLSSGDTLDAIAESSRVALVTMPRPKTLTTRKPTDQEVIIANWLWSMRNPGVTQGIEPRFVKVRPSDVVSDLYLRFPSDMKLLEEAECTLNLKE